MNKRLAAVVAVAAAALLGGCAVYPAPGYATGPVAPQVVAPGPVYMAPAPVYVAPPPVAIYPSFGFYGRWGHRRRW